MEFWIFIGFIINVVFWLAVGVWMRNMRELSTSIAEQLKYTESNNERRHRDLIATIRTTAPPQEILQREVVENEPTPQPIKQPSKHRPKIDWNSRW